MIAMKTAALGCCCSLLLGAQDDVPSVTLRSKELTATVCLPNKTYGHYRGVRFDWSGIVRQVRHKGHSYLGRLRDDGTVHDGAGGLVEEFDIIKPPTWPKAKPGESFVKIGVGVLKKEGRIYRFQRNYRPVKLAPWHIELQERQITFTQKLKHPACSYEYRKTVELDSKEPIVRIHHTLKNTGKASFTTTHYSHMMLCFDHHPIGSSYSIRYPVKPMAEPFRARHAIQAYGRVLRFTKHVLGKPFHIELKHFDGALPRTLQVKTAKQSMTFKVDLPVSLAAIYGEPQALSPELFTVLSIPAGQAKTWVHTFTFSAD